MRGYVRVDEAIVADDGLLRDWIALAIRFVGALEAKAGGCAQITRWVREKAM